MHISAITWALLSSHEVSPPLPLCLTLAHSPSGTTATWATTPPAPAAPADPGGTSLDSTVDRSCGPDRHMYAHDSDMMAGCGCNSSATHRWAYFCIAEARREPDILLLLSIRPSQAIGATEVTVNIILLFRLLQSSRTVRSHRAIAVYIPVVMQCKW
jgi:hypothetical protein